MPLQWRNHIWQSLEEGAGKRCSECDQYPNISEGADSVGGQLYGDKECPFSDGTSSGRAWRKVRESDAGSVIPTLIDHDEQLKGPHTMALRQDPDGNAVCVRDFDLFGVTFDDRFRFRFIIPRVGKTSAFFEGFQRDAVSATLCKL